MLEIWFHPVSISEHYMHSNNALYQSTARYVLTTLIVDIRNFAQYALSPPPYVLFNKCLKIQKS
jgi:hypothetical protein